MKFKKWLEQSTIGTEDVNSSQVESIYGKVKQSIDLVKMYDRQTRLNLLVNISTIANLASGSAYGVFMSAENRKAIGPDVAKNIQVVYPNDPSLAQKIQKLSKHTLLQYLVKHDPSIDPKKIIPSDVIHVDVKKHLQKYGDSPAAIIEIASTIVHEATHVKQYEDEGHTEDGPGTEVEQAEASFKNWVKQNWQSIANRFQFQGQYPFA
jgi:hypothetical protein